MFIYKQWKFGIVIFLIFLSYAKSHQDLQQTVELQKSEILNYADADVNPHSFYYNKYTKTDQRREQVSSNTNVLQFSSNQECLRKYNECVNNEKNEISDESFSRRIINLLLSRADFEEGDDEHIGNIIIRLTKSELEILKNFGEGKVSIREIDSFIPNVFEKSEKYLHHDVFSFIKYLGFTIIIHKDIVLGSIVVLYMTWIILKTKWNMLRLCGVTIMIVFAASFIITWIQLLKDAEIKLTVKQMTNTELPIHCQPDKMTQWDKIWTIFSTFDSCHKYYEARMENSFVQVTPAQALTHMIGTCILQPLNLMGDSISDFANKATRRLWFPIQIILEPILIVVILVLVIFIMYFLAGGSLGWSLGPFSLFSMRRIGNSSDNKHTTNNEKREPIEVILNIKMSSDNQSVIEASSENSKTNIASIEEKKTNNETTELDTMLKMEKTICNKNSASGDSNLTNSSTLFEDSECARDLRSEEVEKIAIESGSGDN